ncbi:ASCH domain-containing protein [Xylanimonas oleitrophica]|uniref:ASCH domain-containing protein n=1 Tax=Xylanimonas oleitrophica TaxID=2607479 RepID=A0A2W5WJ59_9MICO|nr:ASCH domain-containing protein [Xylanimonas oleitrophica]PZR51559.1 ASCH domain-containing protein [Xylanimonas oleitrophica]
MSDARDLPDDLPAELADGAAAPVPPDLADGLPDDLPEPSAEDLERAERVQRFWESARGRAGLGRVVAVTGPAWGEAMAPPAWSFGDSPELADELLGLVLEGTKTGTASLVWEYDGGQEPMPAEGDLSILLDGAGEPRALVRTTEVRVVPFDEVDEEFARSEGEGDRTLASWREGHERYWRRNMPAGREFSRDMPVVCERFELLYRAP